MKKRLLSLLLVGIMMTGLMAGCGKTNADNADGTKVNTAESKPDEAETESGEEELTTVKILARIPASAETGEGFRLGEYPATQKLVEDLEEIGLRLEIEAISENQFADVVNARMAAGTDMPDMISYVWQDGAEAKIKDWADAGLVYELGALLDEYDEDDSIRTYYKEKAPGVLQQVTFPDGSLYWFSYLYSNRLKYDLVTGKDIMDQGTRNISIRQDWVEAVGEEIKLSYTPDELATLLKKMRDEDANGNGKQDEVIFMNIGNFENGFASAFGLSAAYNNPLCGYFEGEYKVFSNFYHENFPAYIEYMQALYENGLYDTEALSSTLQQMVSEERVSAAYQYPTRMFEDYMINPDESKVIYKPIILDSDNDTSNGFNIVCDNNNGTPYCQYFIPTANKNPEAVIRLMDYVFTDEYSVLEEYGVMDLGVILDETGHYQNISGETDNEKALYHHSLTPNVLPSMCTVATAVRMEVDPNSSIWKQAKDEVKYEINKNLWPIAYENNMVEFVTPSIAMAKDEETAFILEHETILKTYATELLTDLILGNKSLEDLPEYQKELEKLGLNEYMDIMQARLDRFINFE